MGYSLTKLSIEGEIERLEKNKNRRLGREHLKKGEGGVKGSKGSKTKGLSLLSPSSTPTPSIEKSSGTSRKCANCGQAGHIKTNKK